MQTSVVVQNAPQPVRLLSEIQHDGWRRESGKGVDLQLPRQFEALEHRLIGGARGDSGAGNEQRSKTKRVTFFLEPDRERIVGLGTFKDCRGVVMVVNPHPERRKSIPLLKLIHLHYVPVASIRLRNARRGFRLVCERDEFRRFLDQAVGAQKRHFSEIEDNKQAFLGHSEEVSEARVAFEVETEPDSPIDPSFVYAVLDRIEQLGSQGDTEESDLSLDIVARALVSLRSEPLGLKLLRECLRGRTAAWLEAFRQTALESYEASKQIQDRDLRADRFRRHVERRMGQGVSETHLEQGSIGGAESQSGLIWTPPMEEEKAPRPIRLPSRAELRRRAAEELAESPEYKAWQAAHRTGPVVTQVGSAAFLEFWTPLITAVQKQLKQILATIPVSGPVLGFSAA